MIPEGIIAAAQKIKALAEASSAMPGERRNASSFLEKLFEQYPELREILAIKTIEFRLRYRNDEEEAIGFFLLKAYGLKALTKTRMYRGRRKKVRALFSEAEKRLIRLIKMEFAELASAWKLKREAAINAFLTANIHVPDEYLKAADSVELSEELANMHQSMSTGTKRGLKRERLEDGTSRA